MQRCLQALVGRRGKADVRLEEAPEEDPVAHLEKVTVHLHLLWDIVKSLS